MARADYETTVLKMLGDPKTVDQELRAFRKDALMLSSKQAQLLDKYARKWIAIYQGHVAAEADTLPALVEQMRARHIPRGRALVRFINRDPRKMIL